VIDAVLVALSCSCESHTHTHAVASALKKEDGRPEAVMRSHTISQRNPLHIGFSKGGASCVNATLLS
jgi:hypothetical protein